MRLKKLTMQAFGPFKDRVIIDFEGEKIDRGLLLISGDTGAGKTTIFDAICYALYGQTSSGEKERTANSLRSDWANPEIDTFVDLEFYYKNKLYEVKRSPEYTRKSKRGDKEVKQVPTAELDLDGRIITKLNDVTKEIENLIGLDYRQFRQVAMLSQGEFTKFLMASSEEKTTIFRKIFGTKLYDDIALTLKNNLSSKKMDVERLLDKIDTEKKNLSPILDLDGLSDKELVTILDSKIKEDTRVVIETKSKRDNKNIEVNSLSTELINIDKLNKDIKTYRDSSMKLNELIESNPNIDKERERYNYNISVSPSISNILDSLTKDSKSLTDRQSRYDNTLKDLESIKSEYDKNIDKYKKIDNYSKDVDELNIYINNLTNKINDYTNYKTKKIELDKTKDRYKDVCTKYDNQNTLYETIRREYYLDVSALLSDTLIDGEKCPVCGSKSHPDKAKHINTKYTKEDLENAKMDLDKINGERKKLEASIEEINKTINGYDKELDIDKLNTELKSSKDKKTKLDIEFKTLTKERQTILENIKSYKDNINIYKDDIKKLKENIDKYHKNLNELYIKHNTNLNDYKDKTLSTNDLTILKHKLDTFDKDKSTLSSTIKLLDYVKDKDYIDIKDRQDKLMVLKDEYKSLDDTYTKMHSTLEKLKSSTDNIKTYLKEYTDIQDKYNTIKILSDTANGTLQGRKRITFENFVQSYFMETVLVEANKRLIKMTDSRYELKKKETKTKLSTKTGLDFSIFDSYTGKERDVSSLSGGEKFKASLALALGLSDTISNNQGGIRIDSLFIDEGFGSLDSESLNQALNILIDLSGYDKLVGIISHVPELMDRIDNKIVVKKTNYGSVIEIEANK